jgi:hypothetical protein
VTILCVCVDGKFSDNYQGREKKVTYEELKLWQNQIEKETQNLDIQMQ